MPINNNWIKTGALLAAMAVVLGAFDIQEVGRQYGVQAHLPDVDIGRAILFQLIHALAIVFVGMLMVIRPGRLLGMAGWSFLLGTLLFSGSLYLVSLTGILWILHLKLVGVAELVLGWILLVEVACPGWNKYRADKEESAPES